MAPREMRLVWFSLLSQHSSIPLSPSILLGCRLGIGEGAASYLEGRFEKMVVFAGNNCFYCILMWAAQSGLSQMCGIYFFK